MREYTIHALVHENYPEKPEKKTFNLPFSKGAIDAARQFASENIPYYTVISCNYYAPGLYRCEAVDGALEWGAVVWVKETI